MAESPTTKMARSAVALLIETSNAYSRELLQGIRDWSTSHSHWAIHLTEQGRGAAPPPWLKDWRGHGIIARIENPAIARAVLATGLPTVNVSASGLAPELPSVVSDSFRVANMAAEHLLERGFHHFAFVGDRRFAWSLNHQKNFAARLRSAEYDCAIFDANLTNLADWEGERRSLAAWLQRLPKPVGIMACYDVRGQQVLNVCRDLGLKVPDEVAVIGQHDDELLCELCDPPLSSVIPNPRQAGYEAAVLLDRLLRNCPPEKLRIEVPPLGVTTRQSTDLVAVADPRLATAMRFIRAKACEAITVDEIACISGMSRSLFERKFRQSFGTAPWEHVLNLRIRQARLLLARTSLGMAEIAERTGFTTAEHFSASFKKIQGVSPKAERQRLHQAESQWPRL